MSSVRSPLDRPRLVPLLHADDCGLSAGITDGIVACHDAGWLRRTSVVVNGAGWQHAVEVLTDRPRLAVNLHLNLFEGPPLSAPSEVDLLVNHRGRFHRQFVSLWAQGFAGGSAARLRAQVQLELGRQIERFLDAFGDRGSVSIDGHVHYHVIPAVFDVLMALCDEYPIAAIRLPREPLYWPRTWTAPRPPIVNLAKNIVLRSLCRRAESGLRVRPLATPVAFIGVLATGAMTIAHVRAALAHLSRRGTSGRVEILFHPGRARQDEASLWRDRPELQRFYLSPDRDREAEVLRSTALRDLLRRYAWPKDDDVGELE